MTRTKLKTGDRQAELVQAALQLAAQRSPAEITTGDLARAVGITQGGVFKHFESKEAIWLAAVDWTHQALIGRLTQAARAGEGDAWQALRAVFMAHIDFIERYPGVPRLVFQELQHARPTPLKDKVRSVMADHRRLVSGLLKQARDDGLLVPGADLAAAAVLFLGAIQGLVMQSLLNDRLQRMARPAKAVFNLYEAGLLAPPPPTQRTRP